MLGFALIILFFAGFLEFPSTNSAIPSRKDSMIYTLPESSSPFQDLFKAFNKWDSRVGCAKLREKHRDLSNNGSTMSFLQGEIECGELKMNNVKILVKKWTWIPDYMDNLYSCRCGLNCLWTQSSVLVINLMRFCLRQLLLRFRYLVDPVFLSTFMMKPRRGEVSRGTRDLQEGGVNWVFIAGGAVLSMLLILNEWIIADKVQ